MSEVDFFEINEAFSVQALLTMRLGGIEESRTNIFGGAIALGHPLGVSGARCLVTLINVLKKYKKKTGVVAVCFGGGGGLALAVRVV